MTPDILFDNFIITNDKAVADKWASDRYSEAYRITNTSLKWTCGVGVVLHLLYCI